MLSEPTGSGRPLSSPAPKVRFSTYWLYAAPDLETALWESGFCTNDATQPGTFYVPAAVAQDGLVATFTLRREVKILDLSGSVLSKLGIYDQIHGNHEWCQWFGLQMFEMLAGSGDEAGPLGFYYPSRKHKNHRALAVQSGSLQLWRRCVDVQLARFADMPEFEALRADANYAEPLSGGFSVQ